MFSWRLLDSWLTGFQDTIRTRHLLGYVGCNGAGGLCEILPPPVREESFCSHRLLCVYGAHRDLVHLVARGLDQHVPSTRGVQAAEQEVVHHHRIAARLLQQCHPLRPDTCYSSSRSLRQEEGMGDGLVPPWMLVREAKHSLQIALADTTQLYHPSSPPYRLRDRRLRQRQ